MTLALFTGTRVKTLCAISDAIARNGLRWIGLDQSGEEVIGSEEGSELGEQVIGGYDTRRVVIGGYGKLLRGIGRMMPLDRSGLGVCDRSLDR
jgi:hypothetical protein